MYLPSQATIVFVLLLVGSPIGAVPVPVGDEVGDQYEIVRSYNTSMHGDDGSSGSSNGRDTVLERVVALREGGLELEYDLPESATAVERKGNWRFPASVLWSANGKIELLNGNELDARIDSWLNAAGWTREVCGRWIFTWNAFRIECGPTSVIDEIRSFDLRSFVPANGVTYRPVGTSAPGVVSLTSTGSRSSIFEVKAPLDSGFVHRSRAEADVVVGEISGKPVSLSDALRQRTKDIVSGTIRVTFETDSSNRVWRQSTQTVQTTKRPDGTVETESVTRVLERRKL